MIAIPIIIVCIYVVLLIYVCRLRPRLYSDTITFDYDVLHGFRRGDMVVTSTSSQDRLVAALLPGYRIDPNTLYTLKFTYATTSFEGAVAITRRLYDTDGAVLKLERNGVIHDVSFCRAGMCAIAPGFYKMLRRHRTVWVSLTVEGSHVSSNSVPWYRACGAGVHD